MWKRISLILLTSLMLISCNEISTGNDTSNNSSNNSNTDNNSNNNENNDNSNTGETVKIIGQIFYQRVHPILNSKGIGSAALDENKISRETAKQITVEAIDENERTVASTSTDIQGNYSLLNIPANTNIKIRAYAKLYKASKWDVKVLDNTNNNTLYAIEGEFNNPGTNNTQRDLTAAASGQISGPFAILDSAYTAMSRFIAVDNTIVFPPLNFHWSPNNVESGTYFDGLNTIVLQGDAKGDSDEYDDHIVIHEWGHYFESKFSRADSIGGQHSSGDRLDIRVAFGEGFGNALSAIITDNPIYFDTIMFKGQQVGWNMNIESASQDTPGWFSEASIQRIIYDLYDKNDDSFDELSLGLKPIYDVLVQKQKNTKAFTSIFSFITELKELNPSATNKINNIVGSENILPITDIYGSNRSYSNINSEILPLYKELDVGNSINICTIRDYGFTNKLGIHRYVYFTISSRDRYTIQVQNNNASGADPDFVLFKVSPFSQKVISEVQGTERKTLTLEKGEYLLDIVDAQAKKLSCFDVEVN